MQRWLWISVADFASSLYAFQIYIELSLGSATRDTSVIDPATTLRLLMFSVRHVNKNKQHRIRVLVPMYVCPTLSFYRLFFTWPGSPSSLTQTLYMRMASYEADWATATVSITVGSAWAAKACCPPPPYVKWYGCAPDTRYSIGIERVQGVQEPWLSTWQQQYE